MCEVTESDGLDADFCLLPGGHPDRTASTFNRGRGTPCCRRRAASLRADQALMGATGTAPEGAKGGEELAGPPMPGAGPHACRWPR